MYKNLYLKFFFLFLAFGIFIIIAVYIINSSVLGKTLNTMKSNFTDSYFKIESENLKNSLDEAKNNLLVISKEKNFKNYINNDTFEDSIKHTFYDYSSSRNEIQQLRYIDINGNEKIRIQKYSRNEKAQIISDDKLQNKKHTNYFKETINLKKGDFYISDFDLNKEYGSIQVPIQPTIRIATCIFDEQDIKKGILVLNINMDKFVKLFKDFQKFDSYLIDKKGNFLLHPNVEKQWSEDLKTHFSVKKEFDHELSTKIIKQDNFNSNFVFTYSLESILNNKQGIKVIYISHEEYISSILKESNGKLLKLIIPLILILGLVLAIYPTKIRANLILALEKNKRNNKIIDKFVPVAITNNKGVIEEVNDAFCELTGYTKEELIGQTHSKLKSGNLNKVHYKNLWKTLKENKTWKGELENKKKNGQTYWIEIYIEPRFNTETKEIEFISIANNITDKKLTEKLAQTDHLTNLYNRKKVDKELEKFLYNVKRYNERVSIMMLDIDYFKLVNDKYGHNVGDSVLIEFANILKNVIRKSDIVGRWGGEEFLIVAPNTSKSGIKILAEKIRNIVDKYEFKVVGHKTVSIGYTQIKQLDSNILNCVKRADEALYRAKENGRNKVEGDELVLIEPANTYII